MTVRVVVNDVMVLLTLVLSWLSIAVRPGGVVAVMVTVRVNPLVVRLSWVDAVEHGLDPSLETRSFLHL